MSTGKHLFKLSELQRALRAAKAAGFDIARIRLDPDGRVEIEAGRPGLIDRPLETEIEL